MSEPRESDLLETNIEFTDLSGVEDENISNMHHAMGGNESVHQASSISSKGFCVKEYEEKMDNLQKENFNLKLKLYFLEQNNVTLPEGIENFQRQFSDLKLENEMLTNDLKEKQDLLQQASIALELLEEEKIGSIANSEMIIDELKNKIKSLEQENLNLQHSLKDLNKSNLGNDTGYADFLGAVDMRDVEMQRKILEMNQVTEDYKQQMNNMSQEIQKLKATIKEAEIKISSYKYERDEMDDKFRNAESESKQLLRKIVLFQEMLSEKNQDIQFLQFQNDRFFKKIEILNEKCSELEFMNFQLAVNAKDNKNIDSTDELSKELADFKEKWATTQCELFDMEAKYKESETERQNTLKYLKESLMTLDEERAKISELEEIIESQHISSGIDKNEAKKDAEILLLKTELQKAEQKLKAITSNELKEKNHEIEKLTKLVDQMSINSPRNNVNKPSDSTSRFSLDHLFENFNDLKFQQAIEIKKQSQKKINELMHELIGLTSSKAREQIIQMKEQMAIVIEKQEMTDDALNRCAELCTYTLDHLHELTQFLNLLLQNKEIRESLSNQSILDIQNILDKSIELSRYSIDGRMSAFQDLSMLSNLIHTARDSIANIAEKQNSIVKVDKSIQQSTECNSCGDLLFKLEEINNEADDLKRVNQLLEDEICEYRGLLDEKDKEVMKCQQDLKILKDSETEVKAMLEEYKTSINSLKTEKCDLTSKLTTCEDAAKKLEERLSDIEEEIKSNWMLKEEHEKLLARIRDDVVNAEAQTAAIRLELEDIRNIYPKYKLNSTKTSSTNDENDKENVEEAACVVSTSSILQEDQVDSRLESFGTNQVMTKVEYSDNKHHILMSTETSTTISCRHCPKYQAQIIDLKKYLSVCYEKLKKYSDQKVAMELEVKKQVNRTENFLQAARCNMENILKSKENKK